MNDSLLIQTDKSGITTFTLNHPEKNNAFDNLLIKELIKQLKKIDADKKTRLVILKAAGKNFCAGADVQWMQRMKKFSKSQNLADAKQLALMLQLFNQLNKPVIGLIQGAVSGGGNGLIACCDVAIAAANATFSFSEVKLGIVPASIAPYVIKAIGSRNARRYFLTAERFNAQEAHCIGLVHQIVPADQLENAGQSFAEILLKNAPKALTAAKQLIRNCDPIDNKLVQKTIALIASIRVSKEAQEGFDAFLEKRNARW